MCYHTNDKAQLTNDKAQLTGRIFKMTTIRALVIYQIPWIYWIQWKFYSI